jgi:hypothetical protein
MLSHPSLPSLNPNYAIYGGVSGGQDGTNSGNGGNGGVALNGGVARRSRA